MARIDSWDEPKPDLPPPGIYRVEVRKAEEKLSGSGNLMFVVELIDLDRGGKTLCTDRLMLQGKGWKFARERLIALGVPMEKEVPASSLVGKRAFVAINHQDETFNDKNTGEPRTITKTNVDIAATEPWGGYWPENAPPPSYKRLTAEQDFPVGEEVPF